MFSGQRELRLRMIEVSQAIFAIVTIQAALAKIGAVLLHKLRVMLGMAGVAALQIDGKISFAMAGGAVHRQLIIAHLVPD